MRLQYVLKTTTLIFAVSTTTALAEADIPLDGPQNDACSSGFHFRCALDRSKEISMDMENSLARSFQKLRGQRKPAEKTIAPAELTTDEVYHAPLRAQTQANSLPQPASTASSHLDQTALGHIKNSRWMEAEAAIAIEPNTKKRQELQVLYVEALTDAQLNAKALGYTKRNMSGSEAISRAQMHVVAGEIQFGDLERARQVASGIASPNIRENALRTVEAAATGYGATARRSQNMYRHQEQAKAGFGEAFSSSLTKLSQGAKRIPENPFIQRTLADAHAMTIPRSNPDRQAYESAKAASARGDMLAAVAAANSISNKTLRNKAVSRAFNTPKIQEQSGSIRKTFQPVSNAFRTVGSKFKGSDK